MNLKKLFQTTALGLALVGASFTAHAAPIGLALVIDESGSIGSTNFNTQKAGYIAALNNVLPTDGSVAVSVTTFASTANVDFAMTLIDSAAALTSLTTAINNLVFSSGGTNIANGINAAAADMAAFGYANLDKAVIDVSTDGFGGDPVTAANNFVAAARLLTQDGEAAVNCLGIGAGANCNFETGDDAFEVVGVTFGTIQTALEGKLRRELNLVPVPATLALFGLGLLGFGVVSKKREQAA